MKNKKQVEVELVVPDPDGILNAYSNDIRLGTTHSDVRMTFGEIVETTKDKIVIEQRAQVTISFRQAKMLVRLLEHAITIHESMFGEVKFPPNWGLHTTESESASPEANAAAARKK